MSFSELIHKDCGRISVTEVTFDGFDVIFKCPCSDWSRVDRYNLNVVASDGEIDYTHISRTDGKYNVSIHFDSYQQNSTDLS